MITETKWKVPARCASSDEPKNVTKKKKGKKNPRPLWKYFSRARQQKNIFKENQVTFCKIVKKPGKEQEKWAQSYI